MASLFVRTRTVAAVVMGGGGRGGRGGRASRCRFYLALGILPHTREGPLPFGGEQRRFGGVGFCFGIQCPPSVGRPQLRWDDSIFALVRHQYAGG